MTSVRQDVLEAARQRRVALDLVPENPPPTGPGPRAMHQLLRWGAAILTVLLVGVVVAAGVIYAQRLDDPFAQQEVEAGPLAASDLAAYRAWAGTETHAFAPVVLTYHDIQPAAGDSPYVVSAEQFARQMQMLQEAGYTTLTAEQFLAYLRGDFTPKGRTVLITFDDGTAGLWRYADPVLARHGFSAVSFLITGRVGTAAPYYLTWDLVRRMQESGRWYFGSHTADLHVRVPTGPDGKQGGALSHRRWVDGALEPASVFQRRVRDDLRRSIDDMTVRGLPRPELFAYPFSDVVAKGVEQEQAKVPRSLVSALFAASFVDVDPGALPVSRREAKRDILERAEVFAADTDRTLFDRLVDMDTLPVADLDPLTTDSHWLEYAGYPAPVEVHDGVLVADARTETYVFANWAPQRTSDWIGYTVSATIDGLGRGGVTGGLRVRVGGADELVVRLSDRSMSLLARDGRRLEEHSIPRAGRHRLAIAVLDGRTQVRIDGRLVAERPAARGAVAHGGFGAVWSRDSIAVDFPGIVDLRVTDASP